MLKNYTIEVCANGRKRVVVLQAPNREDAMFRALWHAKGADVSARIISTKPAKVQS